MAFVTDLFSTVAQANQAVDAPTALRPTPPTQEAKRILGSRLYSSKIPQHIHQTNSPYIAYFEVHSLAVLSCLALSVFKS